MSAVGQWLVNEGKLENAVSECSGSVAGESQDKKCPTSVGA